MTELVIGPIQIENQLPEAFRNDELRTAAAASLDGFKARHEGVLPLKYRIEDFIFQRDEQVCTADSKRKYIGWDGSDMQFAARLLAGLSAGDLPVVLRSHPMEYGTQTPVIHIEDMKTVEDFLAHMQDGATPSRIWNDYYGKIDKENTVSQLIKNPFSEKGLLLCRPTFIHDQQLREELLEYRADDRQYFEGDFFKPEGAPDSFVGMRIIPLERAAREKKNRVGSLFVVDPNTGMLVARDGFPHAAKDFINDEYGKHGDRQVIGRTLDRTTGTTLLHYNRGPARMTVDDIFVNFGDGPFLKRVLEQQLPKIFNLEEEIRQQDWLPKGISETHQFIIFPPEQLGDKTVNTLYYDFRPHESVDELAALSAKLGKDYAEMTTEEKLVTFF